MPKLLSLETADGSALIEVWRPASDVVPIASPEETVVKLKESIRSKLQTVIDLAQEVRRQLESLAVDSAEVEFGFALTSKGSVYVVAVETEATFKVKLTFKGTSGGGDQGP